MHTLESTNIVKLLKWYTKSAFVSAVDKRRGQDLSDVEVDDAQITQALIDADGSKTRREILAEVVASVRRSDFRIAR